MFLLEYLLLLLLGYLPLLEYQLLLPPEYLPLLLWTSNCYSLWSTYCPAGVTFTILRGIYCYSPWSTYCPAGVMFATLRGTYCYSPWITYCLAGVPFATLRGYLLLLPLEYLLSFRLPPLGGTSSTGYSIDVSFGVPTTAAT